MLVLPSWIKKAKKTRLTGKDLNKLSKLEIAESGGIIVILGFLIGVLIYIAIKTFYFKDLTNLTEIFALTTSIIIISYVGIMDDFFGWKIGLGKKTRIFLVLGGTIPLIVINAGVHQVLIPFFGHTNLGLIYPLFLIPLGILGATISYNFLAGFNGLEAGQGVLIIGFLSFVSYKTGSTWLSILGLCMVVSLLAFYFFNKYPAQVFPGDVLTYSIGALIAIMAILGNFEKIAIFIFIPYIIETILTIRGRLVKQCYGKPNKEGFLEMPYKKIYSLTHLFILILSKIKKRVYEKDVVYLIFLFQLILIGLSLVFFRGVLFT